MKIAFLGDVAFLGQFDQKQNQTAWKRLAYLKNLLSEYDYIIANLESPLTAIERSLVCKSMHLKADPCNVELLEYLGVYAVSLANNHIADYGMAGVDDTIRTLDHAGIRWFGIRDKILRLKADKEKINISGFCCYSSNGTHYGKNGVDLLTYDRMKRRLETDRKEEAFSVVAVHWGMEHTNYPAYEHICLMRRLLPSYHAVVCGHHPHIVQGIQKISNSLVAYSVGNAVFDTCVSRNGKLCVELNEDNRKCICIGVDIEHGEIRDYEVKGFYIGADGIEPLPMEEKIKEISRELEVSDVSAYESMRKEQFSKTIQAKFGKHDMKWLLSRLNYYAVGARVLGEIRNKKYKKESKKFING